VKSTLPARYSDHEPAGSFGPDLQFFAAAVIDLQEKRHLADYDPLFRVTKSEALLDVERGRTALTRLRPASGPTLTLASRV